MCDDLILRLTFLSDSFDNASTLPVGPSGVTFTDSTNLKAVPYGRPILAICLYKVSPDHEISGFLDSMDEFVKLLVSKICFSYQPSQGWALPLINSQELLKPL